MDTEAKIFALCSVIVTEPLIRPQGGVEMRNYEIMYIVKPTIDEGRRTEILDAVKKIIETAGSVKEVIDMGSKKLAYEIKKNAEGYYMLVSYEADTTVNPELKKRMKLNEDVIRDLIIKID